MINKNLMLVAMLSMGTALTTLGKVKPTLASLTPPTTYSYSYTWNATDSEQYLNVNGVDSIPLYTRTADGAYYNYLSSNNVIINNLTVTMRFNRSTTTWQASGTSWKPDENRIGANNTVGTPDRKVSVIFNNQTNKNYQLYFDRSGSSAQDFLTFTYNNISNFGQFGAILMASTSLSQFYVPAYTTTEIFRSSSANDSYLDAWYLQDLGVDPSYTAGYDANRGGILTDYLGTDAQQIGWVLLGIAAILFVFKGGK